MTKTHKKRATIAAKLRINMASRMTLSGRGLLAAWLCKQAVAILSEGSNYADKFNATYRAVSRGE